MRRKIHSEENIHTKQKGGIQYKIDFVLKKAFPSFEDFFPLLVSCFSSTFCCTFKLTFFCLFGPLYGSSYLNLLFGHTFFVPFYPTFYSTFFTFRQYFFNFQSFILSLNWLIPSLILFIIC